MAVQTEHDDAPSHAPPHGQASTAPRRATVVSAVIEQRERLLRAVCAHTGWDRHRAEDVLSAVTERVLRNRLAPKRGESWFAYMRDAAFNEAANDRRGAARSAAREHAYVLSGTDPAVDAVGARMMWLDALDDLDTLPPVERAVFWLRHYEGMSYADIAASTGLSVSGVESRLRGASRRLHRLQKGRESDAAYLLLAAFGRSTRRPATTSPVAVTGAVALSVLAVATVPLPGVESHVRPPGNTTSAIGTTRPAGPVVAAAGSGRGAARPGDGPAVTSATGSGSRPGANAAVLRVPVTVCAGATCVGVAGRGERPPGDIVTVRRLNVSQNLTPVCWAVPDNPELTCESDDPDAYRLPGGDPISPGSEPPPLPGASRKGT